LLIEFHRLVNAGHKVGVVRQTETAALKAVGDNKQGPFLRELKNLYTKGTFVEEMVSADIDEDSGTSTGSSSNYLMCIVEENRGGGGPDERVRVGIVVRSNAICATTGVVY
jgi:DNA mismatch repair protein MSH3